MEYTNGSGDFALLQMPEELRQQLTELVRFRALPGSAVHAKKESNTFLIQMIRNTRKAL
jgi:hypothetical protein